MGNLIAELKNRLFESIERLNADTLKGEKLDREIKKSLAINKIAKIAIMRGLEGLPAGNRTTGKESA